MDRKPRPQLDIAGRCACGQTGLALHGAVRSMFMCSCLDCQRDTGTGHSVVALAAAADVTISGTPKAFSRPASSGAVFTRHFCPECGTPLHGFSSRAPGVVMLPVGLFPDTDWFVPGQLIFARSHREWDSLPEGLPRHGTYRDEEAAH